MTSNSSTQPTREWPQPKFYFEVKWGDGADNMVMRFQEVSGLDMEAQPIEYRHGDSPMFLCSQAPDIKNSGNITLKKGLFTSDSRFFDWYSKIKLDTIPRTSVTIRLLDESDAPAISWKLIKAWPTKISATDVSSDKHSVAVETIELAYEGIEISNN